MLNQVRKLLRDRSPDWLNTEVNQILLPNLPANIIPSCSLSSQERARERSKLAGGDLDRSPEQVKPSSIQSELSEVKRSLTKSSPLPTANCSLPTVKGTPHWRRINQVFATLDNAPDNYTYNQLIEYVRATTGKGCSRKLISKWKKSRQNLDSPPPEADYHANRDHLTDIVSPPTVMAISQATPTLPTYTDQPEYESVNSLQLTEQSDRLSEESSDNPLTLLPLKAWSYLAAAGIAVSLVGCEILPFNNRLSENVAIASVAAPITPLTPIPERSKNRLEPRSIKIELTLSNPQDLKVKPGDKVTAGEALSDRQSERNRLQAKKKQLQLSLEKLNLPLAPIPQPRPIPEIRTLPPVSYAEEEAAIKLKQQKLAEANRAIALQQKKIDSLAQLQASPNQQSKGGGNIELILEHERANLQNLEAARQSAQIQLEVAQSKLTTAKERRAYLEYQRQLEQTRRAMAIEQQHQAIQRQKSERSRLLAEREFSQAQIEAKLQDLDYQIIQLSSVLAPYDGTIKKVKWTGQSDHNLTVVVTLSVNSERPTIANAADKPTPDTEAKQITTTQP